MAIYWRQDPGVVRIRDSKFSAIIWTAATAAGVHFDYREGAFETFRLTRDCNQIGTERWDAATPLSSLGRAIREHPTLAGDPLLRLAFLYVTLDYVTALWSKRG